MRVVGELDLATCHLLRAAAEASDYRTHGLRVDGAEVSFIDCAGLAILAELARRARDAEVTFVVLSASHAIARLCARTGLQDLLATK